MLVLSRKRGARIQIGDGILVTVLEIHGQSVRLGISAPEDVRILRGELTQPDPARPDAPDAAARPRSQPIS